MSAPSKSDAAARACAEEQVRMLRDLLSAAVAMIEAKIEYGRNSPEDPPGPLDQWSYDADQLVYHAREALKSISGGESNVC